MSDSTIQVEVSPDGILSIRLNRPDVRNAFNGKVIEELTDAFTSGDQNPKVRLAVLSGEGKVFCAGGDLNWMKKSVDLDRDANLEDTRRLTHMFRRMNEFSKPLIGAIHGAAIGGGVGLVSVCDIAVATEETVLSLSEVKLGLIPACIGPYVIAKVGYTHARRFFMSAERFKASEAKQAGLIHEVVADHPSLQKRVKEITGNILKCGPNAVQHAKKLVHELSWPERRTECADPDEFAAAMLADLRVSEEGQEGVRAFLEKRNPSWIS